jgi:hypothetical protein
MRGRRQRGQTLVLATLAMTTMLGALSMVIDAGVFFVIQRQLQNAADAAALAAVWYDPACVASSGTPPDTMGQHGCQNSDPGLLPPPPECSIPPNTANLPCSAAVATVRANLSSVLGLCAGPNLPAGTIPVQIISYPGVTPPAPPAAPPLPPYVVSVSCDAPRWFARVLPGLSATVHLNGNSAAALGWLGPAGQLQPTAPTPPAPMRLVARLIPL